MIVKELFEWKDIQKDVSFNTLNRDYVQGAITALNSLLYYVKAKRSLSHKHELQKGCY